MIYPIVFDEEGGTVIASVPDLPGTHDEGATREEAAERVRQAALAMIQSLIDDREAVPDPSPADGRPVIVLPSQAWTKVLLHRALRDRGWRKADLARAIGADQKAVNRLFSLFHASRWDQVDEAFRALGKTFMPDVRDAA
ncbi:type II toxin-antitoxin system HicB family antitoxin [Azospirillum thermophilum]|uniref:HicB family protein n=1 Tax=Azospirillum thermophilum TaxID=2202148 RepID=A0A2S2D0W8_9PROT|nr:type II toxin-antitoxin system HicB family antitoxin [Azospirillum thermophilum]AWK90335.1 HicB family protein [Azospirillum thermophilum]